jgi:hypothetical protein
MKRRIAIAAGLVLLAAVPALIAFAPALSRRQRNEDFVPAEAVAQRALEQYLTAWQRGEPVQPVPGVSPGVMGGDTLQSSGKKLESFTILGPVAADAPRCFAVRLKLAGASEELRDRYVVIGLDPLWVMRYADYEMLLHWDHPMPAKKPSS